MKIKKFYENINIDPFDEENWDENEIEKLYKSNEIGRCPVCNYHTLNYGEINFGFDGNQIYYPYICDYCKFIGNEYYELTFIGHSSNHNQIIIDGIVDEESFE